MRNAIRKSRMSWVEDAACAAWLNARRACVRRGDLEVTASLSTLVEARDDLVDAVGMITDQMTHCCKVKLREGGRCWTT